MGKQADPLLPVYLACQAISLLGIQDIRRTLTPLPLTGRKERVAGRPRGVLSHHDPSFS